MFDSEGDGECKKAVVKNRVFFFLYKIDVRKLCLSIEI